MHLKLCKQFRTISLVLELNTHGYMKTYFKISKFLVAMTNTNKIRLYIQYWNHEVLKLGK